MASMLQRVWDESWKADEYESLEECITENCFTYEHVGRLFTELLEYHGGKYDDRAMQLVVEMMGGYIDENI